MNTETSSTKVPVRYKWVPKPGWFGGVLFITSTFLLVMVWLIYLIYLSYMFIDWTWKIWPALLRALLVLVVFSFVWFRAFWERKKVA